MTGRINLNASSVMGGFNPPIHPASIRERKESLTQGACQMDGRVKPAHDAVDAGKNRPKPLKFLPSAQNLIENKPVGAISEG